MTEDQRQHPRFAIELDAEAEFEGERFVGRTRDISRGGFCLQLPQPLPLAAVGAVRLALVFSENSFSEQLLLAATIVWCTPMAGGYQVGFRFGPMTPEQEGYLKVFIQLLQGGQNDDEGEEEDIDHE